MVKFVFSVLQVNALVISMSCIGASFAFSVPVSESFEGSRLKYDWGSMEVSFYGVSSVAKNEDQGAMKQAEQEAWADGLQYIHNEVRKLVKESYKHLPEVNQMASDMAAKISSSTQSTNTNYYADGKIKVELENKLPKIFKIPTLKFKQVELPDVSGVVNTGVRFKLAKKVSPRGIYSIYDENGQLLFDVTKVAEKAFDANTMGRWFNRPSKDEVKRVVGDNPVEVEVQVGVNSSLVVPSAKWAELVKQNAPLLTAAKILIVSP